MYFKEIFIQSSRSALEDLTAVLFSVGITSVKVDDEDDLNELLAKKSGDWDYLDDSLIERKKKLGNGVTFYVTNDANGEETLLLFKQVLEKYKESDTLYDKGELTLRVGEMKEEDWADNWKKYYKPFAVGNFIIKPSWENYTPKQGEKILEIDPGHIFGTGSHETTQLSLEAIEKYVKTGDMVLDVGCGSGILSLAALLSGAAFCTAVDIDKNAEKIVNANRRLNHIEKEKMEMITGNMIYDEIAFSKSYHVAVANIVADAVIALSKKISQLLVAEGLFISSGIITERVPDVSGTLIQNGFEIIDVTYKNQWAQITARLAAHRSFAHA